MRQPIPVRPGLTRVILGVVLLLLLGAAVADSLAVNAEREAAYQLVQSARGAGGGLHHSKNYQLGGTYGQVTSPIPQSSPNYRLKPGFWGPIAFSPAPIVLDEFSYLPLVLHR